MICGYRWPGNETSKCKYEIRRFWLRQNDDFMVLHQNDGMSGARVYCCGPL